MKIFNKNFIKEAKSLIVIAAAVFSFRSMCFEPFRIPSGSMIPTIKIGDFILVNKMSYGVKIPFSDLFTDPIYISKFKSPERGDVIVFKYPKDPSFNYIKRVIGIPGDEIQIIDKVVYVNKMPLPHHAVSGNKFMEDMDFKFKNERFNFSEYEIGKHKAVIQTLNRPGTIDNVSAFVVPEGKYFVMGDNRDFSADSRYWGFVPAENIKGKAMFVWFSMVFPFGDDPFKFRPRRTGTVI